jgi:hypothetical protein
LEHKLKDDEMKDLRAEVLPLEDDLPTLPLPSGTQLSIEHYCLSPAGIRHGIAVFTSLYHHKVIQLGAIHNHFAPPQAQTTLEIIDREPSQAHTANAVLRSRILTPFGGTIRFFPLLHALGQHVALCIENFIWFMREVQHTDIHQLVALVRVNDMEIDYRVWNPNGK